MTTQTIEIDALDGEVDLTIELYAGGSDELSDSQEATEIAKGLYAADFANLPPANYRVVLVDPDGDLIAVGYVTTTFTTKTFKAFDSNNCESETTSDDENLLTTQTIEIDAVEGEIGPTMDVYDDESDDLVDSQDATEAANRHGLYAASFDNLPAATYRVVLCDSGGEMLSAGYVNTTLATKTFHAYESIPCESDVANSLDRVGLDMTDEEIKNKVKSVSVDNTTINFHSANDQIKLEQHEARKKKKGKIRLHRARWRPPGAC